MLFVMISFLMIQLRSFNRLFLVLSVVPMGLIGIVAALLLFDQPLGFVAILGILSLIGMIARNAVILIEQIDYELAQGLDVWNAVIEASVSRFRPIMLTAISTVLGLIPIAVTIFWGPMAIAVMGGLLVATVLTLIFLPALYVAWFRVKEPAASGRTIDAQPHRHGRSMNLALSRPAVVRAVGFLVLWMILSGGDPADLVAGVVAALAATWASLRLLPPGTSRLRPAALARLALRFLRQSVVAGADVARRALDPRLPLRPGFVLYPVGLPPGPARNMFTTLMSLLPGTVPTGSDERGRLLIHCLDVEQPVAAQLAAEEARFARVIGGRASGG